MKTIYQLSLLFLAWAPLSFGQSNGVSIENERVEHLNVGTPSGIQQVPLHQETVPQMGGTKWAISLKSIQSRTHCSEEVEAIKTFKLPEKLNSYNGPSPALKSSTATPIVSSHFEGNWSLFTTPPDNAMAISNGGNIVTCNNDGIEYYNAAGSFLYTAFWSDFYNDNTLNAFLYDPKIVYDSQADRFILILLHGSTATTSKVLVSFSKSSNPTDGWWTYQLTGNPLNNNCWFDYPIMGITSNELFVTGNLFVTNGAFNQAVIYQIEKNAGYSGNNINWQYWSGLGTTPFIPASLIPAGNGHQGNTGPNMYFVNAKNSGSNKVVLWNLTNTMSANPQLNSYEVSVPVYSPAANANQLGTGDLLDNGDCRMTGAFFLNGWVHCVHHSDAGQGWNGLRYYRINVSNNAAFSASYGQQGVYDYAYPCVASFTNSTNNKSVMIGFLRTAPNIYPEVGVINCDDNMNWSQVTVVKTGEAFVNIQSGTIERWGDYIDMNRRHNSPTPKVWMAGSYGANIPSQNTFNTYITRIAEITGIETSDLVQLEKPKTLFEGYPVPSYDWFHLRFNNIDLALTTIELLDTKGERVKLLYEDQPKMGENLLSFNLNALSPGTYFVRIQSNSKLVHHEKIIVSR